MHFSFLLTAIWWAVFTLPMLLWVGEPHAANRLPLKSAVASGFGQLLRTAREILKLRQVALFLIAYFFFIDGVNTIVKMAAPLANDIGVPDSQLLHAIIAVQVVGVPCAFLFGLLAQRFGPRNMLIFGVLAYLGVTFYAGNMTSERFVMFGFSLGPIMILAMMIGAVQGGIQSLSRSYFAGMIPEDESAAFFGFYNVVGKSAAVLGPVLVGVVAKLSGNAKRECWPSAPFSSSGWSYCFACPATDLRALRRERERRLEAGIGFQTSGGKWMMSLYRDERFAVRRSRNAPLPQRSKIGSRRFGEADNQWQRSRSGWFGRVPFIRNLQIQTVGTNWNIVGKLDFRCPVDPTRIFRSRIFEFGKQLFVINQRIVSLR